MAAPNWSLPLMCSMDFPLHKQIFVLWLCGYFYICDVIWFSLCMFLFVLNGLVPFVACLAKRGIRVGSISFWLTSWGLLLTSLLWNQILLFQMSLPFLMGIIMLTRRSIRKPTWRGLRTTYGLLLKRDLINLMVILISGVNKTMWKATKIIEGWVAFSIVYRWMSFDGLLFLGPGRKPRIF